LGRGLIPTTILGVLAVLFAYLGRYKNTRWGLKASFGLIFAFFALRYNFGTDYPTYLQTFVEIRDSPALEAFDNPIKFEIGWLYLNWWFRHLGFFTMVAVLSLLSCIVYYRFLRRYAPPKLYWLGVFLFVLTPEFMLIQASAMRQSIAIMLFVFSIDYIHQRKPVRYALCIALASYFHFTVIVLAPVYVLGARTWKPTTAMRIGTVGTFIALIVFGQGLAPYVTQFVGSYFPRYQVYQEAGLASTGLGFVYVFAMLVMFLSYEPSQDSRRALMLRLAAVWCMLAPVTFILSLLARVGMYLVPATLVGYSVVFMSLRRQPITRTAFVTVLGAFTIYSYIRFFASEMGTTGYAAYRTIFSASMWQ
jgi:hypothetical protein